VTILKFVTYAGEANKPSYAAVYKRYSGVKCGYKWFRSIRRLTPLHLTGLPIFIIRFNNTKHVMLKTGIVLVI